MTSGSCGHFTGQEGVWQFSTDWATRINSTQTSQIKVGMDVFSSRWWDLAATDSLVTAGRGTKYTFATQSDNIFNIDNDYVTAAITPDGTLGVIYLPNAASAITVSWSPMQAGNQAATWVDPTSGATVAATGGATSYSRGANAAAGLTGC